MHASHRPAVEQQKRVRHRAEESDAYAFFNLLTGPRMLGGLEELLPAHRERLFPPTETLSMFLAQVLSGDGSCRQAVNDAALKRIIDGLPRCSSRTGAYCQARARLPTQMISALTRQVGGMIGACAPSWWQWRNRPVRLVDGAMPIRLAPNTSAHGAGTYGNRLLPPFDQNAVQEKQNVPGKRGCQLHCATGYPIP